MAELGGTFDPAAVKDDREVLPAGDQLAHIFESELVDTKAGNGKILKLGWEIVVGELAGRKLWTQENVQNTNAQTQEIGQRNLKRICEAAGVGAISNTDVLHGKPMTISIVVEPAKGEYGPKNGIKGFKLYNPGGAQAPATPTNPVTTPAAITQAAQTPAAGALPWPSR